MVVATGGMPERKAGLRVVGDPLSNRIIRASLVFALASWRPELAEWGPLPEAVAARRELKAALKAYVESVTSRFAR